MNWGRSKTQEHGFCGERRPFERPWTSDEASALRVLKWPERIRSAERSAEGFDRAFDRVQAEGSAEGLTPRVHDEALDVGQESALRMLKIRAPGLLLHPQALGRNPGGFARVEELDRVFLLVLHRRIERCLPREEETR